MSCLNRTMTAVAAAALLSAAVTFAVAQDSPPAADAPAAAAAPANDPNAIIARVGDQQVTELEVTLAREAFGGELANVPAEQQRAVLVDAVANMKLMALGAREAGLDQGQGFADRLEFLKLQALRNAYVQHAVVSQVTDAELQEAYNTLVVSQHKPEQQVHARHILVDTKEAAEKIIAELKGGASFEELAKQSKDPSGQNGGDLGFFGPGQMVPPFETAALALEPGQLTETPVQTEYGWHVIKVEEKRMSEPPSLDQVQDELRNYVLRQKFDQVITALRDKYVVEILDPTAMPPAPPAADPAQNPPSPEAPTPAEEPAPAEPPKN